MGLAIAKFLWTRKSSNPTTMKETKADYPEQHVAAPCHVNASWRTWLSPKQQPLPEVPTLGSIITAGDDYVYSSALFDRIQLDHATAPVDASWEPLFECFANELAKKPLSERTSYPNRVSKFVSDRRQRVKRTVSTRTTRPVKPSTSISRRNTVDHKDNSTNTLSQWKTRLELVSCLNPLPSSQSPRMRDSVRRAAWSDDFQRLHMYHDRPTISLTAEELAAFSFATGMRLSFIHQSKERNANKSNVCIQGTGAFGISLSSESTDDGNHLLHFGYRRQPLSQRPSKGSGYSTLLAKHLALGSLPIAENDQAVQSIVLSPDSLKAIKTGSHLALDRLEKPTGQSGYLKRLPSAKLSSPYTLAFFSSFASEERPILPTPFITAIAGLPFSGGLVPFASKNIISSIRFIASGGSEPGRLLPRLEDLVHKIHRHSPHLELFGPLLDDANLKYWIRERQRLADLEDGLLTDASTSSAVVSRLGRYITLLEHLMALLPDMSSREVLDAVRDATRLEIESAHLSALGRPETELPQPSAANQTLPHYNAETSSPPAIPPRSHLRSQSSMARCCDSGLGGDQRRTFAIKRLGFNKHDLTGSPPKRQSMQSISASTSSSSTIVTSTEGLNLAQQVEAVLKMPLPFDVRTIARVARLVLVAWTMQVGAIGDEDLDTLGRLEGLGKLMLC